MGDSGAERQSNISNPKKAPFDHPQGSVPSELFTIKANRVLNTYYVLSPLHHLHMMFHDVNIILTITEKVETRGGYVTCLRSHN